MFSLRTKNITKFSLFLISGGVGIFFRSPSLLTISLSLLVLLWFEKRAKIKIPTSISVIFMIFIILSLILGSRFDFYEKFSWWDDLLHFSYGLGFAFIGYLVIQYFSTKRQVNNDTILVVLFSLCFTLAGAVLWEIYEFSVDSILGWNTQRWQDSPRGVEDTMWDLILATVAALITNVYIFLYIEFGKRNWVGRIMEEFQRMNFGHPSFGLDTMRTSVKKIVDNIIGNKP